MKKLVYFLITLLILLVIAYFIFMNLPKANVKNKEAMQSISSSQLIQAFNNNEKMANDKYIGKVIEVNGKVLEKMKDEQEAPVVLIGNGNESEVMVTLESNQESLLSKYNRGDEIVVKGQCSGQLIEVVLNKGIILE